MREHNVIDVEKEVDGVIATPVEEEGHVRLGLDEADGGQVGGEAIVPSPLRLLEAVQGAVQPTNYIWASGVDEADGLTTVDSLRHSVALVYYDNVSAVYFSTNPMQHQRTKHVEINPHIVSEYVAAGDVRVLRVPTTLQFVDIFTKGLLSSAFVEFRSSLNICT
jgi:hypothetical protein